MTLLANILEYLQWNKMRVNYDHCPICNASKRDGHEGTCLISLLLHNDKADVQAQFERTKRIFALEDIVRDLTDPDPCWFDHHGYCQAHSWFDDETKCPHQRAKEILANEG